MKKASKYLSHEVINKILKNLNTKNKLLIISLIKTGIRISEFKRYIKAALKDKGKEFISIYPLKRNNQRMVPNIFFSQKISLKEIEESSYSRYANGYKIKKLSKKLSIHFTAHDFRATLITRAMNNNVNLYALIKLTGHKKIKSLFSYNRTIENNFLEMYDIVNIEKL